VSPPGGWIFAMRRKTLHTWLRTLQVSLSTTRVLTFTVPALRQTAQQRAEAARRREKRFRDRAIDKHARGERLLARLFERSADAQAATAGIVEKLIRDDQAAGIKRSSR
jgi:hypothetical protein